MIPTLTYTITRKDELADEVEELKAQLDQAQANLSLEQQRTALLKELLEVEQRTVANLRVNEAIAFNNGKITGTKEFVRSVQF